MSRFDKRCASASCASPRFPATSTSIFVCVNSACFSAAALALLRSFKCSAASSCFGECRDLLLRQTPHAKLVEQPFDRIFLYRSDSIFDSGRPINTAMQLMSNSLKSLSELLGGPALNVLAMGQQVQHVRGLSHIPEIGCQDRVQRLRDQASNISESLDHAGRFLVVDVQDERQRQHRLISVGRDQLDADQILVVLVRFRLAGNPAQDEVHGRHELHFHGVRIDGIFSRRQRFLPHAALARFHLFAIAEAVLR